jgi:hypothetical protein
MNEKITGRAFQLWEYRVSHQQLLIRSPKTDKFNKNIDVIFRGVKLMDIITSLDEVKFEKPQKNDFQSLNPIWFKDDSPYELYILASENRRNKIVAVGIQVIENNLDLFETSLEFFSS